MEKIDKIFDDIRKLFQKINTAKMRYYGESWSKDWDNGSTGIKNPCIYFLFINRNDKKPIYIGETINLGKRLDEHDKYGTWKKGKWEYVKYLDDELLENGQFRQLFECFCIHYFNPIDNDERRKL